jgi:hypothetical protein
MASEKSNLHRIRRRGVAHGCQYANQSQSKQQPSHHLSDFLQVRPPPCIDIKSGLSVPLLDRVFGKRPVLGVLSLVEMEPAKEPAKASTWLIYGGRTGWVGGLVIDLLRAQGDIAIAAEARLEAREAVEA